MIKVLFLDIDGVLNRYATKETIDTPLGSFKGVDRKLLSKFLEWKNNHPNVQIVLSSSWRLDERYDRSFTKHLKELGLTWIDETPNLGHRGKDIAAWLDNNKVDRWAILDDTSDVNPVGRGLIQTSEVRGLEDKHLHKLNELLGE